MKLALLLSQALTFAEQPDIYLETVGKITPEHNWSFYAPHENEHVVNQYVANQVNKRGGIFIVIRQKGQRLIELTIDNKVISVDPNRIFTDLGRQATIKKLNPSLPPQSLTFNKALIRSKKLSLFVLTTMGGEKNKRTWVAIHNNTNGYAKDGKNGLGNVSIIRYQKKLDNGAQYLIDVAGHKSKDEDDLFFVTDANDFNAMDKRGWNAVLQNPSVAHDIDEDDGSLSVYAEMKGFRYINVEAERKDKLFGEDHLEVQTKMVNFTFDLLQ
jgi:hypothetical protein